MKKLLIMGLPGSGKTTLAASLKTALDSMSSVEWINADVIRETYKDWDFSKEGRIRQSQRMRDLASRSNSEIVICDFVAPLREMRSIFGADYLVWMNTIKSGRFSDTNAIFSPPDHFDLEVKDWNTVDSVNRILEALTALQWLQPPATREPG